MPVYVVEYVTDAAGVRRIAIWDVNGHESFRALCVPKPSGVDMLDVVAGFENRLDDVAPPGHVLRGRSDPTVNHYVTLDTCKETQETINQNFIGGRGRKPAGGSEGVWQEMVRRVLVFGGETGMTWHHDSKEYSHPKLFYKGGGSFSRRADECAAGPHTASSCCVTPC